MSGRGASFESDDDDFESEHLAIVGMSGRFPGAADVDELWDNLVAGRQAMHEVAVDELRSRGVSEHELADGDYVTMVSALADPDGFDADFFGYSKREAEIMDPQHRVFLECAWSALENAGYDPAAYDGLIGVFGGVAQNTYLAKVLSTRPDILDQAAGYPLLIASEREYAVTRVAFKLDLRGPAISVNTACSTSGVALHLAGQSVLSGECDMALVGGARVRAPLGVGYRYEQDGILSPDGRCRPFDADAKGTIAASGVGMLVIKRLSDAVDEGDTIHAIVKATAVNNDGSAKTGFTAPGMDGQVAVITEALDVAEIDPATISYVEAHGTGTFIGDPIEVSALTEAYRRIGTGPDRCVLGSVKSNIGHLDAAAGVAGIIKTVQAMRHGVIPPTANFTTASPQIDFGSGPFVVTSEPEPWPTDGGVRRAGISSFGLGGTNSHVVLEEHQPTETEPSGRNHFLLTLSARSPAALDAASEQLAAHLAHSAPDLADVANTLNTGRRAFANRRTVVASSPAEAVTALRANRSALAGTGEATAAGSGVTFLFPGGGAQHPGMAAELYRTEDDFRSSFDQVAEIASAHDLDLVAALYGPDPVSGGELERPSLALPALFAVEYALAQLWQRRGVTPTALIGHSLGEYTAACLAGVFSLTDAVGIVSLRGRLFEELPAGAMLSVALGEGELAEILGDALGPDLSIAAANRVDSTVVAGPTEIIEATHGRLLEREIESRKLHISVAAHSHLVEPILGRFKEHLGGVDFAAPSIPFVSNLTGDWATAEEVTTADYWARHLRHTVRLVDGLGAVFAGGPSTVIEVGPGQTLSGYALRHPARSAGHEIVASLPHAADPTPDDAYFLNSVGRVWRTGTEVDLGSLSSGEQRRRVPLPTYPFERVRHWIEPGRAALTGSTPGAVRPAAAMAPGDGPTIEAIEVATPTEPPAAADRATRILAELTSIFNELSGIDPEALDPDLTFLELGFDSLFMTQATGAVSSVFGVRVSFRQLFEQAPTLRALADHLDEQLPPEAFPAPVPTAGAAASSDTDPSSAGSVHDLVSEQLAIMRRQLDALGAAGAGDSDLARGLAAITAADDGGTAGIAARQPTANVGDLGSNGPAPGEGDDNRGRSRTGSGPWKPIDTTDEGLSATQASALSGLIDRLTTSSPASKQYTSEHRKHLADPRTVAGFRLPWKELVYPVVGARSAGSRIWDIDGNEYLDIAMGFGVNLFGHSPQFVVDAVTEQMTRGFEIGPQSPLAGEVAALITELTGNERVAFCNTGSEAVLAAMRLARTVSGRTKIVTFSNDYHGLFDEVLARGVTVRGERKSIPLAPGIPPNMSDELIVLDYGAAESLRVIEELGPQLAAVLVEPVQSRNPTLQPIDFLRQLRELSSASGTALIFDEMITGFRSHPGGIQELFGVRADLTTYGKVIGGGFPIGVVSGREQYMDALDGGPWEYGDDSIPEADVTWFAGTFVRHPVAMAAAKATLEYLRAEGPSLQLRLNERTTAFVGGLNEFLDDVGAPMQVEHFSSLFLTRFQPANEFSSLFYFFLRDHGIHVTEGRGAFLSTAHDDADLDLLSNAYRSAVLDMQAGGFLPGRSSRGSSATGQTTVPLSAGQQEIWLATQVSDDASRGYNLANTVELTGALDTEILESALQELIGRHSALRTTISADGRKQMVAAELLLETRYVDLSGSTSDERAEQLVDLRQAEVDTAFDLEQGPLIRTSLVRLGPDEHLLFLTVHHIICDGWSSGVLIDELGALYRSAVNGGDSGLAEPMQFSEYVAQQEQFHDDGRWEAAEEFWTAELQNPYPISDLPPDRPRPRAKTYAAERQETLIEAELLARLRAFAVEQNQTLFTLLLGAFECYVQRLSTGPEIAIGVSIAGHTSVPATPLVGHCVNMLPLRRPVDTSGTFADHLLSTRAALLDAFDHQHYSYGSVVKKLVRRRDPGRTPLVSIVFNMDSVSSTLDYGDVRARAGSSPRTYENFDAFVNLVSIDDAMSIECTYNTDLFTAASMRLRLDGFVTLLSDLVERGADRAVAELSVRSSAEVALIDEWNATGRELATDESLMAVFERQVRATPDRIAVVDEERQLTYRELNSRANQLGRWLVEQGVGPRHRVGIMMDRSADMVVAIYATLKAGGAYLPLDPELPADRLAFMVDEAAPTAILTQASLREAVPAGGRAVLSLDTGWDQVSAFDVDDLDVAIEADSPAYVIYTSGSTGRPKGVANSHRGIVNRLLWIPTYIDFDADQIVLQKTPFSFDVSVWELFAPLQVGARLVMARPGGHRDPGYLASVVEKHEVTIVHFVPSMLRLFLEDGRAGSCATLRRVLCSGEALTGDLVESFFEIFGPDVEIHNLYGPTEAAVDVTAWRCEPDDDLTVIPIGRPLANTQIHVLDESLRPVPLGTVGELHIGGVQVALGYLERPDLTAERFIDDPFSAHGRLYKTGDLGRWRADGVLEYHGRNDDQVKIRGNRVELGEIEAALQQIPTVSAAAVALFTDDDRQRLVAYLSSENGQLDETEIRTRLQALVPDYMVPNVFIRHDEFALTTSGKIDRAALPIPAVTGLGGGRGPYTAPATPVEEQVAEIWSEILGVEQVGTTDDFFELGGHSLDAVRANARLYAGLGVELPLGLLFEHPTIASLAPQITAALLQDELDDDEIQLLLAELDDVDGAIE